jgi:hypothetical protein
VSIVVEAPPERPGHVGHTPQPWANLGLRAGRIHDLLGGVFGSGVVRAMLGRPNGDPYGSGLPVEYAMQPFGIPGSSDLRAAPSPDQAAAAHAHTVLALEEAAIKFGRGGGKQAMPAALDSALSDYRTWKAPR